MYPVMIIDDEQLIREGLETIVEWEKFGFYIAATAADGQEAMQLMAQSMPQLLIVDIRMPGMNGFELLQAIQQAHGGVPHVLILSGHADFEYARAALQLKVDGYLLKPLDEEELMGHLSTISATLDARHQFEGGEDSEKWMRQLLAGDADAISKYAEQWHGGEVVLIKPLGREELEIETVIQLKQQLRTEFRLQQAVVFHAETYIGLAWPRAKGKQRDYVALHTQLQAIFVAFDLRFDAAAGGGEAVGIHELSLSFQRAEAWLRMRFWFGGGGVIMQGTPPGSTSTKIEQQEQRSESIEDLEQRLYLAIDAGHGEMARTVIQRLCGHALLAGTEQEWKTQVVTRLTALLSRLAKVRPECQTILQEANRRVLAIQRVPHYRQASEHLQQACAEVAHGMPGGAGPQLQIQHMTELIQRHSAENLRLEMLAELLGYNSSYLGKLFRSTTGVTFNTYLDQVRIEKAKTMLGEGKKVYQVAEAVGYANVDYFHAKFRKYVGVSPSAYRKQGHV